MPVLLYKKINPKNLLLFLLFAGIQQMSFAQKPGIKDFEKVDTLPFLSSAHHWYDIFDSGNIINPVAGQPRYPATDLTGIADNILLYQKDNGGWPKNYDMQAILTDEQKNKIVKAKKILNTTFDNSTTFSQVECLAHIYTVTKQEKYKTACLKGIDFMLSAQYDNGGWPQYYPLEKGYSRHITFNDDAMIGVLSVLKDIVDHNPAYAFVDAKNYQKIKTGYTKGINCILQTQIKEKSILNAWCQQYDEFTLQPAWARAFEPPSICNNESAGIVLFLMDIDHPDAAVIKSIQLAVQWFEDSKITGIRVKTIAAPEERTKYRISKTDRIVVSDPSAPPIWTRYYELGTHKPLFCNRDSKVVYSLAEVDRERRDGYGWYTYEPQKVLKAYPEWEKKWVSHL
jgi:PelA/Pel-15E family pectate lyase